MISNDTIKALTEAIDIVQVIGDYVKLKKRGANYLGLSPFANERTPSFTVSPVKNIFKCFSSGKGGSAITFVMEIDHVSYPEAINLLCRKYGITVEEDKTQTDEQIQASLLSDSIYRANELAAIIFNEFLQNNKDAQEYFVNRGFDLEFLTKWQIGFSGVEANSFSKEAMGRHITKDILVKSDLSVQRENGSLRDKYIDRLIFPFQTISGRIAGFSGRQRVTDKEYPKYTNTSENEIFKKRELLYGIFFAKKAIQKADNCNIVEGQVDVLAMHRDGFENTVASGGTALTKEHIRVIKRLCSRVTFIYDNDEAGMKATSKGIELAIEEGLSVDVLTLPTGEDPDSYLLKYGAEEFKTYYEANIGDIVTFYMGDGKSIGEKEKNERGHILLRLIAIIGTYDMWRRRGKVNRLHKLFNADIVSINAAIDKIKIDRPASEIDSVIVHEKEITYEHEVEFVKSLLRFGHLEFDSKHSHVYLYMLENNPADNFKGRTAAIIIKDYWKCLYAGILPDLDRYNSFEDEHVSAFATSIAFEDFQISQSWEGVNEFSPEYKDKIKSTVAFFKVHLIKDKIKENELLISNCTDDAEVNSLMDSNRILKNNFRVLATRAGISFML